MKESGDTLNDAGRVNLLGFERFHDLEEFVVDLGTVPEFHFDLVEVH